MPRSHRVRPTVRSRYLLLGLLLVAAPGVGSVAAQDPPELQVARDWSEAIPAHVAIVDGEAQLERDGQVETVAENVPLLSGDRLMTRRGRVEVLFADGSVTDLDQYSSVDLLDDDLMRLTAGRLRLTIVRAAAALEYRVDAAGTTSLIGSSGEYRIAIADDRSLDPEVRLTVLRGSAELATAEGRTSVRAGYETRATARLAPSQPYFANVSAFDDFERWVLDRRNDRLGLSAQYLPAELRYYSGAFDHDGWWRYEPAVGYVWYPRVVADWRPYYDGGWSFYGAFGWTWVGGGGRWSWPTHHYGRWGFSAAGWYWIPGRYWAPAWVSWAYAPGYVGWCPLGWNNRPVIGVTQINVHANRPGHGWTVIPDRSFGGRYAAPRTYATIRGSAIPAGSQFASRTDGPSRPATARAEGRPLLAPTQIAARSSATARTADGVRSPSQNTGGRAADSRTRVLGSALSSTPRAESAQVMPRARELGSAPATARSRILPGSANRSAQQLDQADPAARLPRSGVGVPRTRAILPAYAAPAAPAPSLLPYGRSRIGPSGPSAPPPDSRPQYGRQRPGSPPPAASPGPPPGVSRPSDGGGVARSRSAAPSTGGPAPSAPSAPSQNAPSDGGGARRARGR